ncbi:uncharacterized protein [Venturia canescens]|uniref:uncharacterized protein n=1 Tax=Venturia canescens TaxID=32260 RepID=UPI001C9D5207|nr:uncharacterized protein LOC122419563 [Venturia canescens]
MSRKVLLLATSVFFALLLPRESSGSNDTRTSFNDEEDEVDAILENMKFAEFKERYRRLIPYMSYFVANNYVNSQVLGGTKQQQAYERENPQATSPLIRKPQRLVPVGGGRVGDSRSKSNGRGTPNPARNTLHKQENDFVPSVQYDPEDATGDKDYFAPVTYNAKLNYDTTRYTGSGLTDQYREYASVAQQQHQQRPIVHQEGTSSPLLHQDAQYYHNNGQTSRLLPPYDSLYERKFLSDNMNTRVMEFHHDYPLDYGAKIPHDKVPISGTDYSYSVENPEAPVRYINVKPPTRHHPKPTRILAQSPVRRRPASPPQQPFSPLYPLANNPTASLNDIMKSLQLTDRLPEMLNNNNIDSSIRTLIEILGILNNAKQNEVPRLRVPSPSLHRNSPSYDRFQSAHTRPKVITETIFQATPSPPLIPSEPIFRHKPETPYETNLRANAPPLSSKYESLDQEKQSFVEYFTPLTENIDDHKVETSYESTQTPIKLEKQQEFKYQINDDDPLTDVPEVQLPDKYNLPVQTETPINKFSLANGAPPDQLLVPPTALKYGATRGKPNVDYPAYAAIPDTEFNCKEQRYKGFFGDPSTDCQVWHYCDLNGGKSSFLCPNGTIFSQVALTCDWWFNVKCESTRQLYVLNERLYKYILPIMPKFPEDFSGPEVDRYLELKFKEMEAKLKEKKLKKQQEKDKVKEKLQGLEREK